MKSYFATITHKPTGEVFRLEGGTTKKATNEAANRLISDCKLNRRLFVVKINKKEK